MVNGLFRRESARLEYFICIIPEDNVDKGKVLAWGVLLFAGVLEIVWLILFKQSEGFTRWGYASAGLAVSLLSFVLLGWTLKTLPVGTAYAIWTGIGAAGGAIVGILLYGEPATAMRLVCISLIIAGIVGLKLA